MYSIPFSSQRHGMLSMTIGSSPNLLHVHGRPKAIRVHALLSDLVYHTISMTKNVTSPSMCMARVECLLVARGADADIQAHVVPTQSFHLRLLGMACRKHKHFSASRP